MRACEHTRFNYHPTVVKTLRSVVHYFQSIRSPFSPEIAPLSSSFIITPFSRENAPLSTWQKKASLRAYFHSCITFSEVASLSSWLFNASLRAYDSFTPYGRPYGVLPVLK